MVFNVYNGAFLPDIILLTLSMLLPPSGNPIKCHEEFFLSSQPRFPPKSFDNFSPCLGDVQKVC